MIVTQGAVITFWICAILIVYAYFGYPLLIGGFARWFGHQSEAQELADKDLPSVSLLIVAHNEEEVVGQRLANALEMDYPREKLQIVLGSDGSSDRTVEIIRRFAPNGVELLDFGERRGKAAVLGAAIPGLKGEIVLLSDANTEIDPSAARKLVRWFQQPEVGAVCGRLVLVDPATGKNVDGLYWAYETFLKRCEACLGALLGANGAIYAIRKKLYVPIPDQTIVDDFVIPLLTKLRSGCAIMYDRDAVAREETSPGVGAEFQRRCRIGAGGFQAIGILAGLLDPRRGWITFAFFSHKVLRWFCPFFMIGLLASNLLLLNRSTCYWYALVGQSSFYLFSLLMAFMPAGITILKPLRLTTMFTSMNVALLVGFWRWLRGSQRGVWQRTTRLAEVNGASR
jgi:cellulose synthase/poly-beta-1,6-N-acetylglucosamine synthase-like glycosyltransferase